ncbi:MAG: NAD(P)/FAD-dependent oxidoreductase [Actinobacteria bacterium]|nr:NAD(P)/FAD-dependent oxidoreductase [Actinomycetota bacterium]
MVADASPPALLASVAHLTGDLTLLRDDLAPDPARMLEPDAGYTPELVAEVQRLAAAALARFRDAGSVPAPPPSQADLARLIGFVTGVGRDDAYLLLLTEELALDGDRRAPAWTKSDVAPERDFTVGIIGAGMSGIVAAHRLLQAGVRVVLFEKNDEVGGTWWENTYPGCRVDVPNHFYSYSFAQSPDWPQFFSTRDVLLDYFRTCADRFGVLPHVRFGSEVLGAVWDEERAAWVVRMRTRDGCEDTTAVEVLVSATGQLNRPHFPDICGRDRFSGPAFHSAAWDHSVALDGKRVAVIGTGASAVQLIPPVAERAAHTTVFQRTPPWMLPTPNYMDELPENLRVLMRHVPGYANWDRLWIFWRMHEGLLPMAVVDPDWPDQARSVSAGNDLIREMFTLYLQAVVADPELYRKMLPTYPPMAKRIVLDNGIVPATFGRDDVDLETTSIAEITESGVRTVDGVEHECDVLIYGTGFQASKFLTPMQMTGRDGVDLHEWWDGEARAYLGMTIPSFPNLFLMYGPNTNIVINGSIIYFSEGEANYIVESVRMLCDRRLASMDVRRDVHDAYNERVDDANRAMAWGASSVNTWYKNASGRVSQNWPFSLLEFWQRTRRPDPADYLLK